ncbi:MULTISPECIES: hypothetical protein [unclassified Streptomyces]|uniref:hypothetical protein n=1 Tax=unclassified Streptomyces TaxID=2593676 RepID=UPI00344DB830
MTELSTEPVAIPAPAPPPPAPAPTEQAPTNAGVEHTPGGWPVVPLALAGANSTVGMVATAALAGGPVAAMVAATGAVVLGTVAGSRSRKTDPRKEARRAAARTAGRSAARSAGPRRTGAGSAGSSRAGSSRSAGSRSGRAGGKSGNGPGQHRRGAGTTVRHGSTGADKASKTRSATSKGASKHAAGAVGKAAGKVGQVKALRRSAQQAAAGSRAGQRAQTTAARRAIADARRSAKARTTAGGAGQTNRAGRRGGLGGRMLGGAARKARAARDASVTKNRAQRDAKTAGTVAAKRAAVRKAPARRAARQALRRSAARFHGRRLLAALLALPLGLLGMVTTPIGRKFDIPWLMYPGRRLFWRIVRNATEQRAHRDAAIRHEQAEQEAAADAEAAKDGADGIADSVERPASTVPTSTNDPSIEGEHVSGFRFEEAAEEMEQAANSYEPENAMEILAMVEGLPAALTSVANVMKILAERSDSEFPLEKEVADGFNDIFGALMSAVAVAEDMGPLFRQAHEQDIARHEDPRNGTEAEKGWNV